MNRTITSPKAVVLLSGGLDSTVSVACAKASGVNFVKALIFDYGQKAFQKEFNAAKQIAEFSDIELECVRLDWLKNITNTSLVSSKEIPDIAATQLDDINTANETMKSVWVPNRNAVFINIAAAYADSFAYDFVVIGANKEEAATFSDNSKEFIEATNRMLKTSTNHAIEVVAPLIDFDKQEIVKKAVELDVPLSLINSCYNSDDGHCGHCESCRRLRRALEQNNFEKIIESIF